MKKCKNCGKEIVAIGNKQYCNYKCQNDARNIRKRKSTKIYKCEICGKEFTQKRKDNVTCSKVCGRKLWVKNNPEKSDKCDKGINRHNRYVKWRENNRDKTRAIKQRYKAKRRLEDVNFKLNELIGNAIRLSVQDKGFRKWSSILGYSVETLKIHLESTLQEGITWEVYLKNSNKFHIDHIIPISAYSFNSCNDIEFKKCWNYRNLRIITYKENLEKLSSVQPELIKKYEIEDLLPKDIVL